MMQSIWKTPQSKPLVGKQLFVLKENSITGKRFFYVTTLKDKRGSIESKHGHYKVIAWAYAAELATLTGLCIFETMD